ncbi:sucrose utilization SUC1 [Fusarium coicis]|nr:sucrose utilization SUC1 [Fusarium coicis]
MPSAAPETVSSNIVGGDAQSRPRLSEPLTYTGSLDDIPQLDVTPVIGREYNGLQIRDLLQWDERHIRDLAVTISQRGVVFLKNQDVTPQEMKEFMLRLTEVAGCPASSGLHVHPLTEEGSELGDQISVISSEKQKKGGGLTHQLSDVSRYASAGWHSDITFEKVPSDYAMLKIHTLPKTGGDTLWASGYEVYDRLSGPMKKFLEGLTATHDASFFHDEARRLGNPIRKGIRGSPLNQGENLTSVHPLIRTNPVTGWKSVFVNKGFTKRINGLSKDESDTLLAYLFNLVTQNHDAQVRYRWSKNDLAIWDNRSTFHCATYDYEEARAGDRVCSLGEAPYLDLNSKSRREALGTRGPRGLRPRTLDKIERRRHGDGAKSDTSSPDQALAKKSPSPVDEIACLLDVLEVYSERLYPIWPIVDAADLRNKVRQSPNEGGAARCLANAVALAAIAQLKMGTAWRPSVGEAETSGLSEKLGLLDALRISFFLHIYHENALPGGTKSLVYLREAITQAQILRLDRESTYSSLSEADQHVSRRILWLLFVTERGVALLHKLPIVLKPNILFPWFGGADDRAEVLPAFLKLVHLFWVFDQSNIFEILHNIDADSDLPNMAAVAQNCLELLQQKLLDSADNDDWGPINEVQRADMFVTRQWMRAVLWRAALRFGIVIPSMNPMNIAKDFLSLVSELPKAALESHGPTLEFKTFEIATAVIDAIASDVSIQRDQSGPILHQLRDILSSCRGGNRTLLSLLTIRMDAIFNSGRMLEPDGDSAAFEANLASTFQDTAELLTAQPNLTMPTYQFMEGQASQICWPPLDLGYLVRSPSPLTRMLLESMPRDVAEQDEVQQIIETST